jgi:hypothetical protein
MNRSFKFYIKKTSLLREDADKEDILAGLEELDTNTAIIEKYITKIKEYRKLFDPYRATVSYADWIQQHRLADFLGQVFEAFPISNDLEGELVIDSIDFDTESFIHDFIFQDYNPTQLALAEKLLRKLLSDRYFTKNVSDEFYEEIRAAKPVLGIEDGEYEIFESKEDIIAGLEAAEDWSPEKVAKELSSSGNFEQFKIVVEKYYDYIKSIFDEREQHRAAYEEDPAALDRDYPDPIMDLLGRDGEQLQVAYEYTFYYVNAEKKHADASNIARLYLWAVRHFDRSRIGRIYEADDKEDILSGLGAAEEMFVTEIQKTLEDLRNIREYVTSTLLQVRQEDPNTEEAVRDDLRKYVHRYVNKFLDKHPIAGSHDANNDTAIDNVHTVSSIFTEYAFLSERIKLNYVNILETILVRVIDDVIVNGKLSEENDYADLQFEDIVSRAYKDAFSRGSFMQESKEDVLSGLEELDEDDKIVQTVLNNLKEQTKDPSYTNATIWINMFMDTYCPEPEKPGRKERGLTEHDKISHTVHNALNYYINNYGVASDDNKKLFDELAYVLLYDVIVDRDVSDHFRQIYRQYQDTLELPRIALYPQEYGYRESVEGDKEDILSGLEEVEQVNKIIQEVLNKGKEYNTKLNKLDAKRHQYIELGKDSEIITQMALNMYDEATGWAWDQSIRFTELVAENKNNAQSATNLILNRYATDLETRTQAQDNLFEELITTLLYGLITEHRLTEDYWNVWDRVRDELELERI